jgi:hypothetical protein
LKSTGFTSNDTMSWVYSVPDWRAPLKRYIPYSDLNQIKVIEMSPQLFPPGVGYYVSDFVGEMANGSKIPCTPQKLEFTVTQ